MTPRVAQVSGDVKRPQRARAASPILERFSLSGRLHCSVSATRGSAECTVPTLDDSDCQMMAATVRQAEVSRLFARQFLDVGPRYCQYLIVNRWYFHLGTNETSVYSVIKTSR
jgi:hypothetical protein